MPTAATQHTAAGARAFAEFFIKTIDWGYATTSGAYIRHFAAPSCVGCASFANGLDHARRSGVRYIGARISVVSARLLGARPKHGERTVAVTFNISSFEELDRSRRVIRADGAHNGERFNVALAWGDRGWYVTDLALET